MMQTATIQFPSTTQKVQFCRRVWLQAQSPRFNAHQLTIPAVQARIRCWLVLRLSGGGLHHHSCLLDLVHCNEEIIFNLNGNSDTNI